MPKVKTNSSAKKRFRKTATGKIKAPHAFRRKKLTSKSRKRKRHLRKAAYVHPTNMGHMARLLPYN